MRTEAREMDVVVLVPTKVLYQFDDSFDSGPHYYQWNGVTVSGTTIREAKLALGMRIGGGIFTEDEASVALEKQT